ncbi:MAG TPA: amidohydrolase [Thermoanaerobaculia bacterium]|nr:amidohydrolase [Thermoanaerobaculia bacterium]
MTRSSMALLLSGAIVAGSAAYAREADLVLRGGVVYTLDASRSRAEALAVDGGRIVAVGTRDDVQPFLGVGTEVVDLDGRMVLPGFHDSHAHPIAGGMDALACSLVEARTVEAILAKVRECAEASGEGWVVGAGWDLSLFPAANPHESLLDAVVPERPVFLEGADGHSAWVNSKALALAGIDHATSDPPHGVIERDRATGEPSGTLRESAVALVSGLLPAPSAEAQRAGLRHALGEMASFGITSMIDPVVGPGELATYDQADAAGELTARILACARLEATGPGLARRGLDAVALLARPARPASPRLRTGCLKVFVDGVLEGETAALLDPYLGSGSHRGMLNVEPQALAAALGSWDAAGLQVHLHTIGDLAVRVALDALASAHRANGPRDQRHHLAHLQLVHPDDIGRFAALDATATFQPLWAYPDSYIEDVNLEQVGRARVERMYPIGSIHRAGGRIAGGSDWPVSSMNPLLAIEVALTRRDPAGDDPDTLNASERVDLDTMLAAYTRNGAWLARQEAITGSIEVGKAADLVILERDLFAISPHEIGEVRVARTIFGGRTIYQLAP